MTPGGLPRTWNQSRSSKIKLAYWRIKNQLRFIKNSFALPRKASQTWEQRTTAVFTKIRITFIRIFPQRRRFLKKSFENTRKAKQRRRFQKNRKLTSLSQETRINFAASFQEKPPENKPWVIADVAKRFRNCFLGEMNPVYCRIDINFINHF